MTSMDREMCMNLMDREMCRAIRDQVHVHTDRYLNRRLVPAVQAALFQSPAVAKEQKALIERMRQETENQMRLLSGNLCATHPLFRSVEQASAARHRALELKLEERRRVADCSARWQRAANSVALLSLGIGLLFSRRN